MKEYLKNHLTLSSALIVGSILLYSIGFFIHNHYLSQYKVANFDLIKGKYVYTGITYLVFVSLATFLLSFNLSFSSDPRSNFKLRNFCLWFWRFEGFLLLVYSIFPGKESELFDKTDISIFGIINIQGNFLNRFCTTCGFVFLLWVVFHIGTKNEYTKKKADKYDLWTSIISIIPFTFIVVWGVMFDSLFRRLFGFCVLISMWIFSQLMGKLNSAPIIPSDESFFFRDKASSLRRTTEIKIFLFLMFFYLFILTMSLYAKYIYGMLPNNYGGARPKIIQITLSNNKPIEVELIDETEREYIVFQKEEKLISIINKNNVAKIEMKLNDKNR